MSVVIVVGVQWGDEGKGKVVDYLTEQANLVVRFQGGNNAGHTVIAEGQKTALKLIPSGILRPNTRCLLASGVVIDVESLLSEMESLKAVGIEVTPDRLGIAGEVQIIAPYHKALDAEREAARKGAQIGTTRKGIGPCYEDAVSRYGIRFNDLFNPEELQEIVRRNVRLKNDQLKEVLGSSIEFDADEILQGFYAVADRLKPFIANVSEEVAAAISKNKFVVFEGAQGCMLDINHGTYPYVTSSNTLAGYACVSAGFGPRQVDMVLGICKAYCTRVGGGPFPTEDPGADGDRLRDVGHEYGTVTNRPRRCGWLDVMAVKRANRLNGIDSLILTKLDVLSGFKSIKIGVAYKLDGKQISDIPVSAKDIERVETVYEEMPGWNEDITAARSLSELPLAAQNFIARVEALVGVPIGGFSVGPDRSQTIITCDRMRGFASMQ